MKNIFLSAGDIITRVVDGVVESEKLTTAMNLSDRIGYALQRTLIGLIIVFGVLAVIWLVLSLFKVIFYKDPNKKTAEKKPEPKPIAAPAPTPAPAPVAVQPVQDDGAVIAAIVAAISAMRNDEGITDGFRVVSFKRGSNKPWNTK